MPSSWNPRWPIPVMMRAEMLAAWAATAPSGPEDYDLWLRAHAAGARFAKLPEVLVDWRDGPGRLSRTDPRYAAARFRDLKLRALEAGALARRPAVVWGAGPVGKGWSRALRARGHEVAAFVEVHPPAGTAHPRRPVVPVEAAAAWALSTSPPWAVRARERSAARPRASACAKGPT